jgi:hypothetical protein
LFVSVGGGLIRTYDSHGTQTGELETQTNSDEICDMCLAMASSEQEDRQ